MHLTESQYCFFHQDSSSVNTWTNVQNIFSLWFPLVTEYVFENIVIMISTWTDIFFFIQLQWSTCVVFFSKSDVFACVFQFLRWISWALTCLLETTMHRFPSIRQTVSSIFLNIFLTYSLIYSPRHRNVI
jgi:hypothetical protein